MTSERQDHEPDGLESVVATPRMPIARRTASAAAQESAYASPRRKARSRPRTFGRGAPRRASSASAVDRPVVGNGRVRRRDVAPPCALAWHPWPPSCSPSWSPLGGPVVDPSGPGARMGIRARQMSESPNRSVSMRCKSPHRRPPSRLAVLAVDERPGPCQRRERRRAISCGPGLEEVGDWTAKALRSSIGRSGPSATSCLIEMTDRLHVRRHGPANARPSLAEISDRRLDALLRALPPAPERLVARVLEIPMLEDLRGCRDPAPHDAERRPLSDAGLETDESGADAPSCGSRRLERKTVSEISPPTRRT